MSHIPVYMVASFEIDDADTRIYIEPTRKVSFASLESMVGNSLPMMMPQNTSRGLNR
mgnify:FL=1